MDTQAPTPPEALPAPAEPIVPKTPDDAYAIWKADPSPANMRTVLGKLDPVISYRVGTMGGADNPQLRHQARIFAGEAVAKFDPAAGVRLATYVQSHLQSLNRYRRESGGPVKVPERAQLDAWHLEKTTRAYMDEHGVEPDVHTLADRSKLSVKRISEVRRLTRPVVAESQLSDAATGSNSDFLGEALEYVYHGMGNVDRRIIEMTTGYGGSEVLPKNVIAAKLNISPAQVTRRSEKIANAVNDMESGLQEVMV